MIFSYDCFTTFRSNILNDLCHEKRELDSALAWLSTLGGAFSALGDNFEHCVSYNEFVFSKYIPKSSPILFFHRL